MTVFSGSDVGSTAKRKKTSFAVYEATVDFGAPPKIHSAYTYQINDVIQAVPIKAGQTVLGVQVVVDTACATAGAKIKVGYGDDMGRFGAFAITSAGSIDHATKEGGLDQNFAPLYFATADTIDVTVYSKAISSGKVKLNVFVLD